MMKSKFPEFCTENLTDPAVRPQNGNGFIISRSVSDHDCQQLLDNIEFDVPAMSGIKAKIGAVMAATRQYDMAEVCRRYLAVHPRACVVNLGCGLDTTFSQVDNGLAKGYHMDFHDVIAAQGQLLGTQERQYSISGDLNDHRWFDKIDFKAVAKNGYMTGYRPLDKRYGFLANTIFRFGDRSGMCQIIEIDFTRWNIKNCWCSSRTVGGGNQSLCVK